jgi:hypothetical protein
MSDAVDFQVRRDDLRTTRFVESDAARLAPAAGQALLRVDRFAFTANNVTYAVAGDQLSYWSFFPAERGWGRIPVWGYADVVASRCAGVAEGARYYGYYPMSTHLWSSRPVRMQRASTTARRTARRWRARTTSTAPSRRVTSAAKPPRCCCSRCSSPRS